VLGLFSLSLPVLVEDFGGCCLTSSLLFLVAGVWALTRIVQAGHAARLIVSTPLCRRHRHYLRIRRIGLWGSLVLVLLLDVAAIVLTHRLLPEREHTGTYRWIGVATLVSIYILAEVVRRTGIHSLEITRADITLTRVAPGFVQAVDVRTEERRRLAP